MDSEIKEIVYISVSVLVLSIILTFISLMGTIQNNIARTRNDEIAGNKNMVQQEKYSEYNMTELVGEQVIECIEMYYDQNITIFVESTPVPINTFNLDAYTTSPINFSVAASDNTLATWFTNTGRYRAYLVYNSASPQAIYNTIMASYRSKSVSGQAYTGNPTTDATIRASKYAALDSCIGTPLIDSEVTGILIIDATKL